MIKEYNYINIREVLSRLHRNPLLSEVDVELVILYTVDFINIFGMPNIYLNKEVVVTIEDYRGVLPDDLISIIQVKDNKTNTCLRYITDTFNTKTDNVELAFKVLGTVLYTSFKTGEVTIVYKAIPVDEEGYPLLIDNSNFLKALELYIKKEVYSNLFDNGKIRGDVLQHTELQYAWAAGQLLNEFTIPSISEMESITRMWNTLIPRVSEFDDGFKNLGNREYIKVR